MSHITKQLVHSFSVNIRISQPSKVMFTSVNITVLGLTNPDVNLKIMHQLYNVIILVNICQNYIFDIMKLKIIFLLNCESQKYIA